ncbi:hypothetical protein EVG20_g2889 [Dentipellis fragilis]|uniref:F-box domain-containing protein n=1 Tax=Dentipellis fragilis TaxID=205917 RepID=A0A4Y9Z7N2_9AGAM|nr:hypothetical protein EVG20_g2889 [Dentipellis fragilis]
MPSLPPELWKAVLQELAYMPGTLQKGYDPFSIEDHLDYDEPTAEMQAWKQDKRNAILVCKTWRRLALPMLYEILHIDSEAHARGIREALETAPVYEEDGFLGRGDFVRQIYISVRWSPLQVADEVASQDSILTGEHVARIVERCPHLSIFTYRMFPIPSILRPTFDAILGSRAASSLLKLDMAYHQTFWPTILWDLASEALGHLPRLETLVLTSAINNVGESAMLRMPAHIIHAPHLKTLVLPWSVYQLMLAHSSQLDMPELQAIHIMGVHIMSASNTTSGTLVHHSSMEANEMNRKIASIGVSNPDLWAPDDFSDCFAFLAHFPNLRSAHLLVADITLVPDPPLEHPSLTCIAIVQNHDIFMEQWNVSQRIVSSVDAGIEIILAGRFPKLRKVQVVGYYTETHKKDTERVAGWDQKLGERGIALEFCRAFQ